MLFDVNKQSGWAVRRLSAWLQRIVGQASLRVVRPTEVSSLQVVVRPVAATCIRPNAVAQRKTQPIDERRFVRVNASSVGDLNPVRLGGIAVNVQRERGRDQLQCRAMSGVHEVASEVWCIRN